MVATLRKGKQVSPAEILEVESVAQRWQPCLKKKDDEASSEKALAELNSNVKDDAEEDDVTRMIRGSVDANPNKYKKGSVEHHWATASQTLGIYCTLLTEPDTESQLAKMIQQSPLGKSEVQGTSGILVVSLEEKSVNFYFLEFCFKFQSINSQTTKERHRLGAPGRKPDVGSRQEARQKGAAIDRDDDEENGVCCPSWKRL